MLTLEKQLEKLKQINQVGKDTGTVYMIKENSIWVSGTVDLSHMELKTIPFKFGKVTGDFKIDHNKLTSLENCPTHVGSRFRCSHNDITSLEGGPLYVTGGYSCQTTMITSLRGQPISAEYLDCSNNPQLKELTVLKTENPDLKRLKLDYIISDYQYDQQGKHDYQQAALRGCKRVYEEIPELIPYIPNGYMKVISPKYQSARDYGIFEHLKSFKEF